MTDMTPEELDRAVRAFARLIREEYSDKMTFASIVNTWSTASVEEVAAVGKWERLESEAAERLFPTEGATVHTLSTGIPCPLCGVSGVHTHPMEEWSDYAETQEYEAHEDQRVQDEMRNG